MSRLLTTTLLLFATTAGGEPIKGSYESSRAKVEGGLLAPSAQDEAQCLEGQALWRRDKDSAFCADTCVADFQCGPYERCRIIRLKKKVGKVKGPAKYNTEFASDRPMKQGEFGLCDPFYENAVPPTVEPAEAPSSSSPETSVIGIVEQLTLEGRPPEAPSTPAE